ncbi:longitudinals lacking protein, isoforms A/B/D/L-like isoform X1 [Eriocheir sinensis]|uniref:longitudinals lacking protein, isoforms A/B/D/L-like isoform X1 n=1 Tax=Eriocheir sinensis TaxID=95602 RepID=UPI0021C6B50B|nr:longitudinals lacking protein, isoforms A/B/D/L-like isoform X1 [Eriocheir sinensis]XP_050699841.1 longitudinals lacking protein, isoforms A/B/D/L-like isoform X1 [Eriocheir sinensis]
MEGHGQQQYCMRWNTHGSTLLKEFTNLLANTSLVDVTLFAEGHLLKAHKVVLSACSPYFKRLFSETREGHPIVVLKDVGHQELQCLLEYMYRGEVNVAQDQLEPLIRTAESLRIKGLADGPRSAPGTHPTPPAPPMTPPAADPGGTVPASVVPMERVKVKSEVTDGLAGLVDGRGAAADARGGGLPRGGCAADAFAHPPASVSTVPSVLSKVLTMPPALSLAAAAQPHPPHPSHPPPPQDSPIRPGSPPGKRMKRRRRSGEGDSGESDGRSSASPGDPLHALPRIPATITPVSAPNTTHLHQHLGADEERMATGSGGSSSPSPDDSLGGSSRGEPPNRISPQPRPLSEPPSSASPFKPFLPRPDDSSSDANHHSDDEADDRISRTGDHSAPDTPGPSTSRLPPPDEPPHTPSYLGWPYPPDPSTSTESSPFPSLENTNQDYLRVYNLVRAGFPGLLPPRVGGDILVRPPPIGLPLMLKNRSSDYKYGTEFKFESPKPGSASGGSTSATGYPFGADYKFGGQKMSLGVGGATGAGASSAGYPFAESPKQFACEKCGRTYASTGNLKRHKKYECGVEPQFSCPICKKKFQHRHSVKIHVFSTHRNEAGEGVPSDGAHSASSSLFPKSDGVGVGVGVPCKEEFFPMPQEANAPSTQNQDS